VSAGRAGSTSPWSPIVIDPPMISFVPRPPGPRRPADLMCYRPDTVCDGWSTGRLSVRLASVRGYSHRYDGTPRQDDAAAVEHAPTGTVVFAVADGVSSAVQAHVGATLACETSVTAVLAALDADPERIDWDHVVSVTAERLVAHAADALGDPASAEEQLSTTLVVGAVRPARSPLDAALVTMAQVGDSGSWLLRDGSFHDLFAPNCQHADPDLVSSEVVPLPRVCRPVWPREVALPSGAVLLVGTDGFGDPLGDGSGPVGRLFADTLAAVPTALGLAHTLDFSRETFDDDRTLVAIWTDAAHAAAGEKQ